MSGKDGQPTNLKLVSQGERTGYGVGARQQNGASPIPPPGFGPLRQVPQAAQAKAETPTPSGSNSQKK